MRRSTRPSRSPPHDRGADQCGQQGCQLANFVKAHGVAIADALRVAFAPIPRTGALAPAYAQARDAAAALTPDAAWRLTWKEVPEAALRQRVDDWLAGYGAAPLGSDTSQLEPLEQVWRTN